MSLIVSLVEDGLKVLANFVKESIEWLKRFFHSFSQSFKGLVDTVVCFLSGLVMTEKISKTSSSKRGLYREFPLLSELVEDIVDAFRNLDWCDGGFWDCMSEAAAEVMHKLWEKMSDHPVEFVLEVVCLCQILELLFMAF